MRFNMGNPDVRRGGGWAFVLWLALVGCSHAAYPDKPINLVVPYAPGAMSSVFGSVLAQAVGADLQAHLLVEYKPGANGGLGAAYVAKAPPDGYTLLMAVNSTMAINPNLYPNLQYEPSRDFTPVAMLYRSANVLVVKPDSSFKSVADIVAYAKAHPGKLNIGSSGNGSTPHLSEEMFQRRAGISLNHVPYTGIGPALVAVMGGQIDMMFADMSAMNYVRSGQLRALAVTSKERMQVAPDLPTMQQAGVPDFDVTTWYSIVAPKGVGGGIVERLNSAFTKASRSPQVEARMNAVGMEPVSDTSAASLARTIQADREYWHRFLQETGIRIE
jgi:tripartite-type tricarboxylate transporter receptor subunit TctC